MQELFFRSLFRHDFTILNLCFKSLIPLLYYYDKGVNSRGMNHTFVQKMALHEVLENVLKQNNRQRTKCIYAKKGVI